MSKNNNKMILIFFYLIFYSNCYNAPLNSNMSVSDAKPKTIDTSDLTGFYEYYEGVIGQDSAFLFLQKIISPHGYYMGYLYLSKEMPPIVLTGNEEIKTSEGVTIEIINADVKKWYKEKYKEKIQDEELVVLTNHSHSLENYSVELLLEGVRQNGKFEGTTYKRMKPTEKTIGETFVFQRKKTPTFFDISFYKKNYHLYGKKKYESDTIIVQSYYSIFLPKTNKNNIFQNVDSCIASDWASVPNRNITEKLKKYGKNQYLWSFRYETYIVYDKDGLLSIILRLGNNIKSLNYIDYKKLELIDIVIVTDTIKILNLLKRKAVEKLENVDHTRRGIDDIVTGIIIEDNCSVTPNGLLFTYTGKNHKFIDEIFGAMGLQLFIPFRELKESLNPKFIKQLNLKL
jgi:hypothetical protein